MIKRQVIFSRAKDLRKNDITEMLNDFFNEILKTLEITFNNYKKSNDEKYITEIKNVTGNSINDEKLIELLSGDKKDFLKNMEILFSKKQNARVEILGHEQNSILEKKIFLQIIDFSWRSHLQYLEQLRQVIGLRQYGQKDPLSEFKKEAFVLFESLLSKIKSDIIKLLLNLNIEISTNQEEKNQSENTVKNDLKKVGRNEKCPCGSGKNLSTATVMFKLYFLKSVQCFLI